MMVYDWISLDRTTPNRLRCDRCGVVRSMSADDGALDDEAHRFVHEHKLCKAPRANVKRTEGTKR
jgi:hypothetical protein